MPALAFVNGLDREHADFEAAVESLRALELKPVVLTLPIGAESRFSGVIDLLRMKALGTQGEARSRPSWPSAARDARQQLVETVAECDDALLEKYLEEGALADDEILRGLVAGTRARAITPVLCGSATLELGIAPLLWAATELLPSAADRGAWPVLGGRHRRRGRAGSRGALLGAGLQDHDRPLHRHALGVAGGLRQPAPRPEPAQRHARDPRSGSAS